MRRLFFIAFFLFTTAHFAQAQESKEAGNWQLVTGDQGTDIMAAEAFTGRLFVVRCHKKKTSAFVVWNEFVGPTPRVEYRIDDQGPKEQVWNSSSDGGASFFPGRVIEFLKKLEGHDQLTAKVTPKGTGPIIAEFEITGIEDALKSIREVCKWE